jgi:hypothetical protein
MDGYWYRVEVQNGMAVTTEITVKDGKALDKQKIGVEDILSVAEAVAGQQIHRNYMGMYQGPK